MSISVRPPRAVRVALPIGMRFDKALEFVRLKRPWIQRQLARIAAGESERRVLSGLFAAINKPEAELYLTRRLGRLAKERGFAYNRVSVRSQKTRWGSCSRSNNISLNVKLAALPADLTDYVILHELVHTRVPNHGKNFWAELDRQVGDSRAFACRLKDYDLGLP